jgi:hypothetical protein
MSLIGDNKLRLDFGTSASVVINLIAGKPPEWLALIPKGEPMLQSQIFAPQLEAAVKRVHIVSKEGTDAVRMEFADGKLKVSAKGGDQEISSTFDTIHTQGESTRIAINQKYVLGYLSGKQGIINFSKYTESGPAVFEDQQAPRMIVMPMVVAWGDEPAATKEEPQAEVLIVAVYCLLVSICMAGGLIHSFTCAVVVAAGELVADFEEHAINDIIMATSVKNRRSNF